MRFLQLFSSSEECSLLLRFQKLPTGFIAFISKMVTIVYEIETFFIETKKIKNKIN